MQTSMGEEMSNSVFPKVDKCTSVKIWSRETMTDEMMQFGWSAFNQYQRGLVNGEVSESGCVYSNKFYMALARKTKQGFAAFKLVVILEVKVASKIIPDEIYDKLDRFTFAGLYDAIKQAKAWRKNNKHSEVSIECNIATYRFKWTKCGNMHLIDVIKKGER